MVDGVHILVVQVGSHRCGLLADQVVEVLHAVTIAALPGAPASVEGAINLRGAVVPVIDLRHRFGLDPRAVTPADRLVIIESDGRSIALRADHALDLVAVSTGDLRQALNLGSDQGHATGVVRLPDGLMVIFDSGTFISGEDAVALEQLLANAAIGAA